MRDALRAAEKVPGLLDALTIHLIEASAALRERNSTYSLRSAASISLRLCPEGVSSTRRGRAKGWGELGPEMFCNPPLPPTLPTRGREFRSAISASPSTEMPVGLGNVSRYRHEFLYVLPIRQLVFLDGVRRERETRDRRATSAALPAGRRIDFEVESREGRFVAGAILELRAGEEARRSPSCGTAMAYSFGFIDDGPAEQRMRRPCRPYTGTPWVYRQPARRVDITGAGSVSRRLQTKHARRGWLSMDRSPSRVSGVPRDCRARSQARRPRTPSVPVKIEQPRPAGQGHHLARRAIQGSGGALRNASARPPFVEPAAMPMPLYRRSPRCPARHRP